MRVLMLTWEYPPEVVGGLGRHVGALATALAASGHDVTVVTRGGSPVADMQVQDGVRVVRAAADPLALDFTTETLLAWTQAMEHTLLRAALATVEGWRPDVVHAHDWLVAQSAVTVAQVTGAPLVTTVHATEIGRHQGWLPQPLNRAIHSLESWLASRSDAVVVCAAAMRDEVVTRLQAPPGRVHLLANGLDADRWRPAPAAARRWRARLAPDGGPLLVVAGRLVHEKGVQDVLDALPRLRADHPGVRLAVAGTGPHEADLRARAGRRRVSRRVTWLGFVGAEELAGLFTAADAVAVPSRYEPFGLVALEAAACGAPLVVADTGGLADLAADGTAAAAFAPGDAAALAAALGPLLADPAAARAHAARVARRVRRDYRWPAVADGTATVYASVLRRPAASARGGHG